MNFKKLAPEEIIIIKECLKACLEFFEDDWEFPTLFGLEKAELHEITHAWPNDTFSPKVQVAVNNCVLNLLNYPGVPEGEAWNRHISASHHKVRDILRKINGEPIGPEIYDKESLILYAESNPVTYLFFWGHQPAKDGRISKSCFSQWYPSFFDVDKIVYPTAEHFMMAEKARLFGDNDALQKILAAETPKEAKALGRQIRGYDEKKWSQKRFDIALAGNLAKFKQNQRMADFLDSTRGLVLVEASPVDPVWGIGLSADDPDAKDPKNGRGSTYLGSS